MNINEYKLRNRLHIKCLYTSSLQTIAFAVKCNNKKVRKILVEQLNFIWG